MVLLARDQGADAKVLHLIPGVLLTESRGPKGGLLSPMLIITIPFERIGIDIVGALMLASTRYILVVIDYAT